jgi:hypothetical protein
MVVHACNSITQEAETRKSQVPSQPELHSKILSQKKQNRVGGVIQVIEHLPTSSSNPSTANK